MAAGWNADPTGRHALRYFDGLKWTDDVSDGSGSVEKDPELIGTSAPVTPAPPVHMPPPPGAGPYVPQHAAAYPQQPYGYPQARPWNGLAIAGFVLSIVWVYGIGSVLAVIFGHISRSQMKRDGKQGGGLALAGLIIGYIGIVATIFFVILLVALSNDPTFDLNLDPV